MERRFKTSRFLTTLDMDAERVMVAHPLKLRRTLLTKEVYAYLRLFSEQALSLPDFILASRLPVKQSQRLFQFFFTEDYLVAEDQDEEATLRERLLEKSPPPERAAQRTRLGRYTGNPVFNLASFANTVVTSEQPKPLKIALLGGCLAHSAADHLKRAFLHWNILADVQSGWPDDVELLDTWQAELVIFQPAIFTLLGWIWNGIVRASEEERLERLERVKAALSLQLQRVLGARKRGLLLVQGFSLPQFSPYGRADFRVRWGPAELLHELNRHLKQLLSTVPDVGFIDTESLLANAGKASLVDDTIAPYNHHGPFVQDASRGAPGSDDGAPPVGSEMPVLGLLADEYVKGYVAWASVASIKCVVVDLDNTLWPGVVGEGQFSLSSPGVLQELRFTGFGGLHEALGIVKQRGVLLAVCSNNNRDDVLAQWRELAAMAAREGLDHVLTPEDFALLHIDWSPKHEGILQISEALQVDPSAMLFIDDNPVERERVRGTFPAIRVLGEDLNGIRRQLLDDPCLQSLNMTAESAERTSLVRAKLERDREFTRFGSETDFLRSLGVRLRVRRVPESADLGRLAELTTRTNQFNTTLARHSVLSLQTFLSQGGRLYSLEAADRHGSSGLVGVCLLAGTKIELVAVSCRVIGLQVAVPFLVEVLRLDGCIENKPNGHLVQGPRNQPARALFKDAGFTDKGDGHYVLEHPGALARVNREVYTFE